MSAAEFFAASNVLIVAGKGGVGKTTVGATVGIAAARAGCDVLLIELEGYSNLASLFGLPQLGYHEVGLPVDVGPSGGRLRARQLPPDDALADYLDRAGLGPLTSRLTRSGAIDVVATAAPGIRDLLALGKIRQIEQAGGAELIVVDAPAAGHALTFLTAAAGLAASTSGGPIRDQADQVLEMFADDERCQVMLVTLPEETPITEAVETAYNLEEDVGIKLAPLVVNGMWPAIDGLDDAMTRAPAPLAAAAAWRLARIADQRTEIERLGRELPLEQLHLPFLFRSRLGVADVMVLADALTERIEAGPPVASGPAIGVGDVRPISVVGPVGLGDGGLVEAVGDRSVVLCLGSGGVGKTTTAAALGIALARRGERVAVLTIDPARRLADTLGERGSLSNEPSLVAAEGRWDGELWAAMLDPAATLQSVVRVEAESPEQAERILANPLFRNLTTSLSGTNEYMAAERLHQLHNDARFDRVIIDTPPSRHMLDFLDSPGRLTRFINHRLYRSVFAPKHRLLKTINAGTQVVMRLLARLVGTGLVDDVIAFFADFEGLDNGFRRRASEIDGLLAGSDTAYVLVTAPRHDPLQEAGWILGNLERRNRSVDAVVVNRRLVVSPFEPGEGGEHGNADDPLRRNHAELSALADGETALVDEFRRTIGGEVMLVAVPERVTPVRDLDGLADLAGRL